MCTHMSMHARIQTRVHTHTHMHILTCVETHMHTHPPRLAAGLVMSVSRSLSDDHDTSGKAELNCSAYLVIRHSMKDVTSWTRSFDKPQGCQAFVEGGLRQGKCFGTGLGSPEIATIGGFGVDCGASIVALIWPKIFSFRVLVAKRVASLWAPRTASEGGGFFSVSVAALQRRTPQMICSTLTVQFCGCPGLHFPLASLAPSTV